MADNINQNRLASWSLYHDKLSELEEENLISLPTIPVGLEHNAHMFYIKLKGSTQRQGLINFLKEHDITTAFHYIPLHTSVAGGKYSLFNGEDKYTTKESEKLLRLPMFYSLTEGDLLTVVGKIKEFFSE